MATSRIAESINSSSETKQKIVEFAKQLNFTDIGFAKAEFLKEDYIKFQEWLTLKCNADMTWLERNSEIRFNPELLLQDCKSVIVLAYNYNHNLNHENIANTGKIARYAWGRDYHNIIPKKLKKMGKYIQELSPNSNFRAFCDSSPIAERQWAVKAGIGWQGKNTLILDKKNGSYFFLSIILSNLEFESSLVKKNMCGTCTRCIDACPTGALVDGKYLDSNKCISYHSIENKNDVPKQISQKFDNWIFGCDICQEVCPYNNPRNPISIDLDLLPRSGQKVLELDYVKNLDDDAFKLRFNSSPVSRTKVIGLKRNAQILENNNKTF